MRGKYSKYWRSIQKRYASKQKAKKQQEKQTQTVEGTVDKDKEKQPPEKKKKKKIDDFKTLFTKVSNIMHELWLERNTDRHNPAKGQLRIAKITEATRVVEHLYSL